MRKQTIFSLLFLASGLFLNSVAQAEVNLDELDECPILPMCPSQLQELAR